MAALADGSGVTGATTDRLLNKLQYAVANKANAIDTAATGDVFLAADASADYEIKRYVGTDLLVAAGVTASVAEINYNNKASGRIVTTTATALSLTEAAHAGRMLLINTNSTVANTFTLPAATGTGDKFHLVNGIAQTQGTVVITAATGDVIKGKAIALDTTAAADAMVFKTTATSIKVTYNLTTTGGLGYDTFEAWDIATNTWLVNVSFVGSGTLATPFSA